MNNLKAYIYIFHMHGCQACAHYVPRARAILDPICALRWEAGQLVHNTQAPPGICLVDIQLEHEAQAPSIRQLADRYQVRDVPVSVLAKRGFGAARMLGSRSDAEIIYFRDLALQVCR